MRKEPIRRGYMYLRRIQRDLGAQGAEDGRYMYRYVLGCVSNVSWPKWLEYIRYLYVSHMYLERIEDAVYRVVVSGVYRECIVSASGVLCCGQCIVDVFRMYRGSDPRYIMDNTIPRYMYPGIDPTRYIDTY